MIRPHRLALLLVATACSTPGPAREATSTNETTARAVPAPLPAPSAPAPAAPPRDTEPDAFAAFFRAAAGEHVAFAAEHIEATLPEGSRAPTDRAVDGLAWTADVYEESDELHDPGEKLIYELRGCVMVVTSRNTRLRSPRGVFESETRGAVLSRLGLRALETDDPNLVVAERIENAANGSVVIFDRDGLAFETHARTVAMHAEHFDDDEDNNQVGGGDTDPLAARCEARKPEWFRALLRSARRKSLRERVTRVDVPGPGGGQYTVSLPANTDGYTGEWRHGREAYVAVDTEYGRTECGSVLISTTEGDYLEFESPEGPRTSITLFGARLSVADESAESTGECRERLVFVTSRGRTRAPLWFMCWRGDDTTLAPLLEALGSAQRVRR